ncbi:MAG TPA: glycosyltransferase family 2 protein, partial [Chryseosolibacter sp.]|nr:glycosyltransferase family 2 protein [Chryseosolibacter sp.]
KLLERNIKVYFAKNIIVFDEKVANHEVFERQRKRWISSHFFYLRKYFTEGWRQLFKGNIAFFNSAVLRNIQLPRLLNLGLLTLVILLSAAFSAYLIISPLIWISLLGLNILAMVFAVPKRFYNRKLLRSAVLVPRLFIQMFLLLFKLKGANKTFIHTPHGRIEMNVEKK